MEKPWRKSRFNGLFRFDVPVTEYELLETERGEPGLFRTSEPEHTSEKQPEERAVSGSIAENRARIERAFHTRINPDIIFRPFPLRPDVPALAVFVNGMADSDQINEFILKPAQNNRRRRAEGEPLADYAALRVFLMQEVEITDRFDTALSAILEGRTAVFLEGETRAVLMDTRGFASRGVGTTEQETVVLGPREAFTENLRTNVTLLRRIIKLDDFVCEFRASGGKNNTRVVVAYLYGVANAGLVSEVKRRLAAIDKTAIISSGLVEQLIETHPYSPLPTVLSTERPDRAAAHIMNGFVALLVEGSPIAMILPTTLFLLMSSAQDTYMRQPIGTVVRLARYVGAFLATVMPGYFIALAMHHQGMLSGEVLSTVVASRSMVFLPLPLEMLFLLLAFQLVREAGLSVPGVLGQSIGIIGGLLMGQAAVSANICSSVVLIIVALSGIGMFTITDYSAKLAVSYFRVALILAGWLGGLLGLTVALFSSILWLANLKSYGVPFLSPVSPKTNSKGPAGLRGRIRSKTRLTDFANTRRASI